MARRGFLKRFLVFSLAGLALVALIWVVWVRAFEPDVVRTRGDGSIPVARTESRTPPRVDYRRLDARLQRLMEDPAMVGLAVAVVEDGQIRFARGYGETVAGSGEAVTPGTVFRWASLSKGVAGDLIALLAAEGELSLTDPVAARASSLRLPDGNEHKATIVDLLTHRLGLYGHAQDSKLEDGWDAAFLRGNLATLHNICPPGTCHAYQNVAYDAASEIVERVTGRAYADVVHDRLFGPLGMSSATVTREALLNSPNWARPHRSRAAGPVEVTDSYYRVPAAGGVNGSIWDLAIWMSAQTGMAPDILPPAVLDAAHRAIAPTPREMARRRKFRERITSASYGLGWRSFDYAGHRVVGHHGGVTGYRSLILFDPQLRSGVVALWNSSSSRPNGIEYEVMDMIYRLPFRDWLEIEERSREAQPEPDPDNEGGSG